MAAGATSIERPRKNLTAPADRACRLTTAVEALCESRKLTGPSWPSSCTSAPKRVPQAAAPKPSHQVRGRSARREGDADARRRAADRRHRAGRAAASTQSWFYLGFEPVRSEHRQKPFARLRFVAPQGLNLGRREHPGFGLWRRGLRLWFAWLHGGMVAGNCEPRYEARAFVKFAQSTNQSAHAQRYASRSTQLGSQRNRGARQKVSGGVSAKTGTMQVLPWRNRRFNRLKNRPSPSPTSNTTADSPRPHVSRYLARGIHRGIHKNARGD